MSSDDVTARLRARLAADPVLTAVVAFAVVALLARLVFLGDRIMHFDEGRVAYWALQYQETGTISYRYIVHGPFVQYVDAALFGLLGQSDAVARLPLAIFGALLPLSALLFRERLRDVEVAGVAAFLALNPVLLYYSRFLRSTLLVAGLSVVAFGCLVRAYDGHGLRYVYAASALVALAFAAKENAAIYLLVWIGATGVLVVARLFWPWREQRARDAVRDAWGWLSDRVRTGGRALALRVGGHAFGVLAVFFLVALFFYAPRNPAEGVGFWQTVVQPWKLPQLLDATIADVVEGYGYWFGGSTEPGCRKETLVASYGCFLWTLVETFAVAAAPLSLLAVGGFVLELWGRARPRPLVLFAAAWGTASVVGYPLGMDIQAPWVVINALVPLTIVAAVGLGWLVRQAREAEADGDRISVAIVVIVVALMTVQVGAVASEHVYQKPAVDRHENVLVQYAQPADDYRPVFDRVASVAGNEGGPHVVLYGDQLIASGSAMKPGCASVGRVLPIQWYLAQGDLQADCVQNGADVSVAIEGRPPLVVTQQADASLRQHLDGYVERQYYNRAIGGEMTFFVRPDVAGETDLGGRPPAANSST